MTPEEIARFEEREEIEEMIHEKAKEAMAKAFPREAAMLMEIVRRIRARGWRKPAGESRR